MLIEYIGGKKECNNHREMMETLRHLSKINEVWISHAESFPCMAILISDDKTHITYFPEDGHPGFRALGNTGVDDITFFVGGNEYYLEGISIVPFDMAIQTILWFYNNLTMWSGLEWDEMCE